MDMAAFGAPQGPVLKAGSRGDSALDCQAGLASGTMLALFHFVSLWSQGLKLDRF